MPEEQQLLSAQAKDLVRQLGNDEGIFDIELDIRPGSVKGDNYIGQIAKVRVDGKNKNGKPSTLHLIVKTAPKSEGFRKLSPIADIYSREVFVYKTVLPLFQNFQIERCIDRPFSCYAKFFTSSLIDREETLIMLDMKAEGFAMADRRRPLNYAHSKLVFEHLGRWHALSFAFRDQKPQEFLQLREAMPDLLSEMFATPELKNSINELYSGALDFLDPNATYTIKYKKCIETLLDEVRTFSEPEVYGKNGVILHGDCWCNNILFKYADGENLETPVGLCFLDWQISRHASPAVDLSYYLYSCTDKELRDKHFQRLLRDYYSSFSDFLIQLGSEPKKLYPFEELLSDFKKFSRFGMAMALTLVKFMTSESEEISDFGEVLDAGKDFLDAVKFTSKNESYYQERITDVIAHAAQLDFMG